MRGTLLNGVAGSGVGGEGRKVAERRAKLARVVRLMTRDPHGPRRTASINDSDRGNLCTLKCNLARRICMLGLVWCVAASMPPCSSWIWGARIGRLPGKQTRNDIAMTSSHCRRAAVPVGPASALLAGRPPDKSDPSRPRGCPGSPTCSPGKSKNRRHLEFPCSPSQPGRWSWPESSCFS
jgi:hypothetical protein